MARSDSQPRGAALPVRSSEQLKASFRTSEQQPETFGNAEQNADVLASELFDHACKATGLENKDIAHLCGVSVSLVEKWRSRETRGCPSFIQMLLLPPAFHIALHRAMNQRMGFGRAALQRLMDAASDLALVIE